MMGGQYEIDRKRIILPKPEWLDSHYGLKWAACMSRTAVGWQLSSALMKWQIEGNISKIAAACLSAAPRCPNGAGAPSVGFEDREEVP